ncbi:MAG TPA: hypothetical protein VIL86_04585 [Tepidisphaeraceae bacterium]|jgi:hypothetical protein
MISATSQRRLKKLPGLAIATTLATAAIGAEPAKNQLQDYFQPDALAPLKKDEASLYRTPWRAHLVTVPAYQALEGIGIYYKHVPAWSIEQHTNVLKQMSIAGVKRIRLAVNHGMYITKDWSQPKEGEMAELHNVLFACKAAGIRPTCTFVHIPPMGKAGTDELQKWWHYDFNEKEQKWVEVQWNGPLMPAGEVGSPEFKAYQDKTYQALKFILTEARAAGFTGANSYDLEMGQNLWWGAPARSKPLPSTDLSALKPGGRIYEFDKGLIDRLRQEGFTEPQVWMSQSHHVFDEASDEELPNGVAGRAISFYTEGIGVKSEEWGKGSADTWPVRTPPRLLEGTPPSMVLARPEGWMADRSRHENLVELMQNTKKPVAITALGTVPDSVPNAYAAGLDGWQIKQRSMGRSYAFWLNQGAAYVLWHSAYESGAADNGAGQHSVLPSGIDPAKFQWYNSKPLATLKTFTDALADAKPLEKVDPIEFKFDVVPNPVLIEQSSDSQTELRARDAVALLPFQIDAKTYAVAAYVVSPNVTVPMKTIKMTLRVDKAIKGGAWTSNAYTQTQGPAQMVETTKDSSTMKFDLRDDVTWVRFTVE